MENTLILYPIFALVALTLGIGIRLGVLRFAAVRRGDLTPRFYELNRGGKMPDYLAKVSQNYDNLLELPILFYLLAVCLFITDKVDMVQLLLAWLFIASRYAHSYIHITDNKLRPRMRAFLLGVLLVIVMWVWFLLQVLFF